MAADSALDDSFTALAALELGQDLQRFQPIRQAVAQSQTDEKVRADLERRLIELLQGDATDLAKDYACRQLALVGSDACLPTLADLLRSPRLSYMARFALEGIHSPKVCETLRAMLGKTKRRQKAGVVISLGRLADIKAVTSLASLLEEEDEELCEVALIALGRIGTADAAEALQAFADKAPSTLQNVLVDAQLDAAESLCEKGEHAAAAAVFESLLSADSTRVKAAACRGLIAARPAESLARIVGGLANEEAWRRAVAADCIVDLTAPKDIETIAAAIPDLPDAGKIAAFLSLKGHSSAAVREAALKSLDSPNADVRTAALAALIMSAKPDDVAVLAEVIVGADNDAVRDAAFETLRLMPADGTNEALAAYLMEAETVKPILVQLALARRSQTLLPVFLKAAASSNKAARLEAFRALEIMATEKEAEALVTLLSAAKSDEEREAAGRAVWKSCQQVADPAQRSAPLLAAMKDANAAGQCAVLPVLARIGGDDALAAVHAAMKSSSPEVRDAGYRALANWPDATVADELLEIAKTSDVESYRIWALRAYARVVALPSERPPQETFKMLAAAMKLATRTEERQLIVARLGAVRTPESLALLLSYLDDAELKAEAVPAVFEVAKGLSRTHPDEAKAALEKIQSLTEDPALVQQIPRVLRDIRAREQKQKQ